MALEYLLEVRSREMPAEHLESVLRQLGGRLFEELMGLGLAPQEILTGVTPRRLMICCQGLPEQEPDREAQEVGPSLEEAWDGEEPTAALLGFAERVGTEVEALETLKTERGAYVGVLRQVAGRPTRDILAERIPRLLAEINWPDRFRWRGDAVWVRPILSIVSLLDGEILPFEFDGIQAGNETAGHPFLSPETLAIEDYNNYLEVLSERGIEVVWKLRRQRLLESMTERARKLKGRLEDEPELLEQLTAHCEVPGVVEGRFDPEFLGLPEEILLAVLRQQHLALPLRNKNGDLLPLFLTTMDRPDDPEGLVKSGQERALAGRLVDARFHYEADRQVALAARGPQLEQLSFHSGLGNYAQKSERVGSLAVLLAEELGLEEHAEALQQAAALYKTDLTTDMIRELPRLRGTLAGLYAREEGYVEAVWRAIAEHYRPATADSPIPSTPAGQILAMADRLDTLVGFLGLGQLPKGSKDPYALRRMAQGLLRILLEAEHELDLDLVGARAVLLYGEALERGAQEILTDLQTFLGDRLTQLLGQRGYTYDEIEAATAVGHRNLPDLVARIEALRTVREEADFRSLVLAAKRISNLVDGHQEYELQTDLLSEEAESELAEALANVRKDVDKALGERRYADGLRHIEALVPALDRFFAEVLVMDENEERRQNRIALLQSCRRIFWRVARLKEMTVDKAEATKASAPPERTS